MSIFNMIIHVCTAVIGTFCQIAVASAVPRISSMLFYLMPILATAIPRWDEERDFHCCTLVAIASRDLSPILIHDSVMRNMIIPIFHFMNELL